MKFNEAFKKQLAMVAPVTEAMIGNLADETCAISGEPYQAGDTVLFVMVPAKEEGIDFAIVTAKKSVLEAKDYTYLDGATSVPRVDPKTYQG